MPKIERTKKPKNPEWKNVTQKAEIPNLNTNFGQNSPNLAEIRFIPGF
jgi:hypothetical protein